jgi:hypothetical protein
MLEFQGPVAVREARATGERRKFRGLEKQSGERPPPVPTFMLEFQGPVAVREARATGERRKFRGLEKQSGERPPLPTFILQPSKFRSRSPISLANRDRSAPERSCPLQIAFGALPEALLSPQVVFGALPNAHAPCKSPSERSRRAFRSRTFAHGGRLAGSADQRRAGGVSQATSRPRVGLQRATMVSGSLKVRVVGESR